ncbi:MAG: hypothetical protein IPH20_27400 [Bacteroidales bacterium]|nr:hypothetical protein [Bacteroidales bacterium]
MLVEVKVKVKVKVEVEVEVEAEFQIVVRQWFGLLTNQCSPTSNHRLVIRFEIFF